MSRVTLIELSPRRPSDGVVVPLRFSHNARNHCRFFGHDWRPAVASLPTIEMDMGFDGQKFGQGALPQVGTLILAVGRDDTWPALVWKGAACTIREATWPPGLGDPSDGDFGPAMPFRVERIQANEGAASLTLVDVGRRLERPLIERRFGTTGVGLLDSPDTIDLRARPVPTGWGVLRSVPGVLVDRLDNVWLFLDRPATGVPTFYDGGAAFSPGVAHTSLAALKANPPAEGAVDYVLDADGLFLARPWTEPAYPFTADVVAAGPEAAADIAAAIVAARGGPSFAAGTVAAFAALHPEACGIYIDDDRTIGTALDQLVAGLGGFWRLNSRGEIVLGRLAHAAPAQVFAPGQIVSIRREDVVMPTRRRGVGWGRNNRVHSEGEIAGILLVDWADITGPNKPADGATRNSDGFNLIPDPIELSQVWHETVNSTLETFSSGGRLADRYRVITVASGGLTFGWTRPVPEGIRPFPVSPGETLYCRHVAFYEGGATGDSQAEILFYDAAFNLVSTVAATGSYTVATVDQMKWRDVHGSVVVPADVAYAWPSVRRFSGANRAWFGEPYFGRAASGATRNIDRGEWSALAIGAAIILGDEVQDQGSTWGAIVSHTKTAVNGPPTLPATSNATWRLRAKVGDTGPTGPAGLNSAPLLIYRRAATSPTLPSATATYTFATGAISGLDNGWTATVPAADGNPLWVSHASASSTGATDTIAPGEWSAPALMVEDAAKTAVAYLYQRAVSAPGAPTNSLTYDFGAGTLSGTPGGGWSTTIPATDGNPLWVRTAVAFATGATDTIAPGEWSASTRLVEDGAPGADGLDGLTGGGQASFEVACTAAGVVKAGQLPQTRQLSLYRGATNLTTSATWSVSGVTGGTITVGASTGLVTLSAISADTAAGIVTATIGGESVSFPVSARKVRDGAGGVAALFSTDFPSVATAAQLGISSEIALPAEMELRLDYNAAWEASSGTVTCGFWFQARSSGGTWSTLGGAESASAIVGEPALVILSRTLAAASVARIVEVRVVGTNSNIAATINATAGPATANGVPA